jgi:hypothetical protein
MERACGRSELGNRVGAEGNEIAWTISEFDHRNRAFKTMKPNLLYRIAGGLSIVASLCFTGLFGVCLIGLAFGRMSLFTREFVHLLSYLGIFGVAFVVFYAIYDGGCRLTRIEEQQEEILRELRNRGS